MEQKSMITFNSAVTAAFISVFLLACSAGPTAQEAEAFVDDAEARLMDLSYEDALASWAQSTYIIHDTQTLASRTSARMRARSPRMSPFPVSRVVWEVVSPASSMRIQRNVLAGNPAS